MVLLLDWTEKVVFEKNKQVNSVKHAILKGDEESFVLKWALLPEDEEKKARFFITPKQKGISFPNNVILKNKDLPEFRMCIVSKLIPDKWTGELNIESSGIVKKIPLEFEKLAMFH